MDFYNKIIYEFKQKCFIAETYVKCVDCPFYIKESGFVTLYCEKRSYIKIRKESRENLFAKYLEFRLRQ